MLALGGTFKLPGLQKYLQQNLQLDVERLDTISSAPSSESKLAPTFNENVLSVVSAYGLAIGRCSTRQAPSYVIPANDKVYRNWAVTKILIETLREMDPRYPQPKLDVPKLLQKLRA